MKKLATFITILVLGAFAPVVTAQDAVPPAAAEAPAAAVAAPVAAPEAAPAPAGPDAAAVAADTLAYFNNVAPTGPLAGLPGPGHNGFLMICAALVLFMTLPGLALFYGGLVRHKNVLSVMAQCLGLAGLVTIMWFVFGYSFVFGGNMMPRTLPNGLATWGTSANT